MEATLICVDNSEWMRNGDYTPTRLESQYDAVNLICGAKTQSNPESTVGIMTSAGRIEVLVSLTTDVGKILSSSHNIKLMSEQNTAVALQVAQLVLKNRQNKSQQQRIILFVGSPISVDKDTLIRTAKKLKKNNVAVDVISFGEDNTEKLDAFIKAVDNKNNSHFVKIPTGYLISDVIISSPIISGDSESGSSGPVIGGVDPNVDPELAMALQASLEEERQRQASLNQASKDQGKGKTEATPTPSSDVQMYSEEDELRKALEISMQTAAQDQKKQDDSQTKQESKTQDEEMEEEMDSDTLLALQMSMENFGEPQSSGTKQQPKQEAPQAKQSQQQQQQQPEKNEEKKPTETKKEESDDITQMMNDPDFVNSILSSLPGVDPNDERIKDILDSFKKDDKKSDEKKDK